MDVLVYDYETDAVVWVVVNMKQAMVSGIVEGFAPFQPPLAAMEIEKAALLAAGHPLVAVRFPDGPPRVVAMMLNGEGTACPVNRCVVLAYERDGRPVLDFLVLINLSSERVAKVIADGNWQEVYQP